MAVDKYSDVYRDLVVHPLKIHTKFIFYPKKL